MKRKLFLLNVLMLGFLIQSCTSYLIPVDSFKAQFSGIDSAKLKKVEVEGPYGERYSYLANPIKIIRCVDKKGNSATLKNSPSIEIRFTFGENNKRSVFYFDRLFVNDTSVIGISSRFISALKKEIPLNSITKIEIQDGRKKFSYVN